MGPRDPFATRPAPPGRPRPEADRPEADGAPASEPPVRVQARLPEEPRRLRGPFGNAAAVGAVAGLVLGGLVVTLGVGRALVVLAFALVGAALGALLKNAFAGGLDVGAAWRALRRR